MELSVAQTRVRIYGEIRHSARSIKAYTEFHPDRPRIQTSFNFNNDLEEDGFVGRGGGFLRHEVKLVRHDAIAATLASIASR